VPHKEFFPGCPDLPLTQSRRRLRCKVLTPVTISRAARCRLWVNAGNELVVLELQEGLREGFRILIPPLLGLPKKPCFQAFCNQLIPRPEKASVKLPIDRSARVKAFTLIPSLVAFQSGRSISLRAMNWTAIGPDESPWSEPRCRSRSRPSPTFSPPVKCAVVTKGSRYLSTIAYLPPAVLFLRLSDGRSFLHTTTAELEHPQRATRTARRCA
jgi:hypothetical protein